MKRYDHNSYSMDEKADGDYIEYEDHVLALMEQDKRIAELEATHRDLVKRNAMLRERPDLPAERIPAYRELLRLQEENRHLKAEVPLYTARIAELEAAIDKLAQCKGRFHTEANFKALIAVREKNLHK